MLKSAADGGGTVPLANTQATIDVTGKSGDTTFRRVRQTLPHSSIKQAAILKSLCHDTHTGI